MPNQQMRITVGNSLAAGLRKRTLREQSEKNERSLSSYIVSHSRKKKSQNVLYKGTVALLSQSHGDAFLSMEQRGIGSNRSTHIYALTFAHGSLMVERDIIHFSPKRHLETDILPLVISNHALRCVLQAAHDRALKGIADVLRQHILDLLTGIVEVLERPETRIAQANGISVWKPDIIRSTTCAVMRNFVPAEPLKGDCARQHQH